ncbi:MAG: PIN domain-containing protein [Pseudolabrys sp.]
MHRSKCFCAIAEANDRGTNDAHQKLQTAQFHPAGGSSECDARFLDTNILLYLISRDPGETPKRNTAIALLDTKDIALSVQVLQEFYVQATRPTRTDVIDHDIAVRLVRTWLRFKVREMTLPIMTGALEIKANYGPSD